MRPRRTVLLLFLLGAGAVGTGYLLVFVRGDSLWSAGLVAAGAVTSMVAGMALGALRSGRLEGLLLPFVLVLVLVGGGMGALLLLPPADPAAPSLVLGLPLPAAVLLYGIGLVPILVVPVAYARTFDRVVLREEDLDRVRRIRRIPSTAASGDVEKAREEERSPGRA